MGIGLASLVKSSPVKSIMGVSESLDREDEDDDREEREEGEEEGERGGEEEGDGEKTRGGASSRRRKSTGSSFLNRMRAFTWT